MIIYRFIEQICLEERYLFQLAYRFHRGTKCNFHCEIKCFHPGNIRHPLSVQPALMSVEVFTIFVLKRFFKKTDHSSVQNVIPPSNTDDYFLPNVFSQSSLEIQHFDSIIFFSTYIFCLWKSSRVVVFVIR